MPSCVLALMIAIAAIQSPAERPLRLHTFESAVFGNSRLLRVLVPEGYDAPENQHRDYPVLFLNDGQNLFDSATAVFNPMEWRVDETVAQLTALRRLPPVIVVGIDNAGRRQRAHEYLPYPDRYLSPPEPDPQGARYPAFLVDEVLPFIRTHYRVRPGPASLALGGSSYGALIALYTVLARPGTFGQLLLESPSLYVDSTHILRDAEHATRWPERIYLGVGTNEAGRPACDPRAVTDPEPVSDVLTLATLIRSRRNPPALHVVVEPCAVHNEAAWARRLPDALDFLYGNSPRSDQTAR